MLSTVKDWNDMCYHGWAFAGISGLITLVFLYESPRYLISRGEFTEATKMLPIKEKEDDPIELEEDAYVASSENNEEQEETLATLWQNATLRTNLMTMTAIWSFSAFAEFFMPFYLY